MKLAGLRFFGGLGLALSVLGCSKNGLNFPGVTEIIAQSAPSGFAAGRRQLGEVTRDACTGGYASPSAIFSCLSTFVLSDTQPSGGVGQWFLYWITALDNRLTELETRFDSNPPACQAATGVDFSFVLDSSGADAISGTTSLAVPATFSCRDDYTAPDGNPGGGIAWGTKDGATYLMDRSSGNGGLSGVERIISIAKVNAAADEAEIWIFLNGTSANTPTLMRIKGNKTTDAFSYEARGMGHNNNLFKYLFIRSNGTDKMYVAGQDDTGNDLAGTLGTSQCVSPSSFSTTASGCTTDGLDLYPSSDFSSTNTSLGTAVSASAVVTAFEAVFDDALTGVGTAN